MRIRGLYALTPELTDTERLADLVRAALQGGAGAVQYRSKQAGGALARRQAERLREICAQHGVAFIVNDSVELARDVAADGVHLGRDDAAPARARERLGAAAIIGVSCYDALERAQRHRHECDYCAFGSVFASSVKPDAVRAPLELLTAASAQGIAVVAIGGIDADNIARVVQAGARAAAVITALFGDGTLAPAQVERNARQLARAFGHAG